MRADADYHAVTRNEPGSALIQMHLEGRWPDETSVTHHQPGAAVLVSLQVKGNFALDHGLLAFANLSHVRNHVARHGTEVCSVACHVAHISPPDFIFTR